MYGRIEPGEQCPTRRSCPGSLSIGALENDPVSSQSIQVRAGLALIAVAGKMVRA
jgi:hypothetical protein